MELMMIRSMVYGCLLACMQAVSAQISDLSLRGDFTGNWTDPSPNNQGIQIEVLDNSRAVVIWFTFDQNGNQQWLAGLGDVSNDRIEVDLRRNSGGNFPPELIDQQRLVIEAWGHASIQFSDCSHGEMSWTSNLDGVPSGSMQLRRVTALADLPCSTAERYHHNAHFSFDAPPGNWQALVADFSGAVADGIDFVAEWRQLPEPLQSRYGFMLSGSNASDDLAMMLATEIGGLQPNALHLLRLEVTFATNVPAGCAGIGGSPGEAVTIKLGASSNRPEVIENDGEFSFNIDKGNQTSGGEDAMAVGDISNSQQCDDVVLPGTWQLKTLKVGTVPMLAVSDDNGRLWIYVLTDSGFEGRSTLYVTDFRVAAAVVTAGTVVPRP